ncbi:hypothetical protein ABTM13_19715, partial [Acinetobacter baumannii]
MTDPASASPTRPAGGSVSKLFAAWTIISALAVWGGLTIAESRAAEYCRAEGLAWNWRAWACAHPGGTIVVPQSLR